MDRDRFALIVAAYGATPVRWPAEERAAAEAFARDHAAIAAALLADADRTDALLFEHRSPAPAPALRERVLAAASRRRRLSGRARIWWSGLGFALAAGSGMLAGSAATAALEPASSVTQLYGQSGQALYDDAAAQEAMR